MHNFYVTPPRRRFCSNLDGICLIGLMTFIPALFPSVQSVILNSPPFQYNNFLELTDELHNLHRHYPNLTRLYSIGKSDRGRDLWVLAISDSPNERPLGRPMVKFIGNMHGNEPVGRALLIQFAHHLLRNYPNDTGVGKILNRTEIHLLPTMNPDGFEMAEEGTCSGTKGRYNARGTDLNRNFPDFMRKNFVRREKETKSIIKWLKNHRFVLSANFHGGAVVASYPWDNYAGSTQMPKNTLTEDHDIFYHLARTYADRHSHMHTGLSCGDYFEGGVTNGAAWFPLTGGMQDFNYVVSGVMEITLEVSCCKFPPRAMLRHYWEENKNAMLEFVQQAQMGVRGVLTDERQKPIPHSFVTIDGRNMEYETTERGEYWRLLLPGNYTLRAFASGYYDETQRISVTNLDGPLVVDFVLKKKNQRGEFIPPTIFNDLPNEFKFNSAEITNGTELGNFTLDPSLLNSTVGAANETGSVLNSTMSTVNETTNGTESFSSVNTTDINFVKDSNANPISAPKKVSASGPTTDSSLISQPSGEGTKRRILLDGLTDTKLNTKMRSSRSGGLSLQFSAGLAPRTKYHRRVFESLFPFAAADFSQVVKAL